VHRAYWTPAPEEKERLSARFAALDWRELLRLHHLVCLDLLHAAGLSTVGRTSPEMERQLDAQPGPDADLCAKSAARLLLPESPYRPRLSFIFQRKGDETPLNRRAPDQTGELRNASLTHLGALEVIRLDPQQRPAVVDFVPFDAIQTVHLGPPSLYPPARIDYEESGRSDVACLPLLYGPSWFTPEASDRDGSMTRFICHVKGLPAGIGLGHQDLTTGTALFGLGSLEVVEFPLDASAPDFQARCQKRGLDPSVVRKATGK
jgi:hypothetical protein